MKGVSCNPLPDQGSTGEPFGRVHWHRVVVLLQVFSQISELIYCSIVISFPLELAPVDALPPELAAVGVSPPVLAAVEVLPLQLAVVEVLPLQLAAFDAPLWPVA